MGLAMPESLVACMCLQAERVSGDFKPQDVANLVWAAAALDIVAGFVPLWTTAAETARQSSWPEFGPEGEGQLHQFFLAAAQGCSSQERIALLLLGAPHVRELVAQCRAAFVARSRGEASPSRLQAEVASTFRRVLEEDRGGEGLEVLEEQVLEEDGGGYSMDMILKGLGGKRRVAVEVDGPSHFVKVAGEGGERRWRENGSTRLKRRLLAGLGWEVLSVPFFEWTVLRGKAAKEAYARRLLQTAGVV